MQPPHASLAAAGRRAPRLHIALLSLIEPQDELQQLIAVHLAAAGGRGGRQVEGRSVPGPSTQPALRRPAPTKRMRVATRPTAAPGPSPAHLAVPVLVDLRDQQVHFAPRHGHPQDLQRALQLQQQIQEGSGRGKGAVGRARRRSEHRLVAGQRMLHSPGLACSTAAAARRAHLVRRQPPRAVGVQGGKDILRQGRQGEEHSSMAKPPVLCGVARPHPALARGLHRRTLAPATAATVAPGPGTRPGSPAAGAPSLHLLVGPPSPPQTPQSPPRRSAGGSSRSRTPSRSMRRHAGGRGG